MIELTPFNLLITAGLVVVIAVIFVLSIRKELK